MKPSSHFVKFLSPAAMVRMLTTMMMRACMDRAAAETEG